MYIKTRLAISLFSLLLAILYRKYKENVSPLPIPILDLDQYWGAGEKPDDYSANKTIELVKIIYHEDVSIFLKIFSQIFNKTKKITVHRRFKISTPSSSRIPCSTRRSWF